MFMDEKRQQLILPQNIVLEDRKKLSISAVKEVDSFDEQNIIANTSLGELTVSGTALHINRFSTEEGELVIEGEINTISYSDETPVSHGFFGRIFR